MICARCVVLACVASCGVRTPAAIDVDALLRVRGPVEARRDLVIRVTGDPRDVAARLALAEIAERLQRPSEAIEALDVVVALGGPLGTRWHDADRARLARLIAARGRARLARGAASAEADLLRARKLGAAITDDELRQARIAGAIVALHHSDAEVRASGRRVLAEQSSGQDDASKGANESASKDGNPGASKGANETASKGEIEVWLGARPDATPEQRARLGVWLWQQGAKRAAWDELAAWHATTAPPRDRELEEAYLVAERWWVPLDQPGAPDGVRYAEARPAVAVPHAPFVGDARSEAAARHASLIVPGTVEIEALRAIAVAFSRDPAIADRLAGDAVAGASDAAAMQATLGALYDALGDPARARAAWQAAVDASPEPVFLRGLAEAQARQGDADAALVNATTAAAASGDPAVVWTAIAHALVGSGRYVHALEAARSAIDLAGPETLASALDAAIAASRALGRNGQADALAARRAKIGPASGTPGDRDATEP